MLAPELKMPVANERSALGKYSAVAFSAAGKLPASPSARMARAMMKPHTEAGNAARPSAPSTLLKALPTWIEYAWAIAPSDQMAIAMW
jgi:hypothetical protein